MLNCRDVASLVTEYLESAMGPWRKANIRLHLLLCPDCRIHVNKMRKLVDALKQVPPTNRVSEEALESLHKKAHGVTPLEPK